MYVCSVFAVVLSVIVMGYVIGGAALVLSDLGVELQTLHKYRRILGLLVAILFIFLVWPIFQKPVWWFFSHPQKDEFLEI